MTLDLFAPEDQVQPPRSERLGEGTVVLRGYALAWVERLLPELRGVLKAAPFRRMVTPGGFSLSVALSNCGALGWTTDLDGYRYSPIDPRSGKAWPGLPAAMRELAVAAAAEAGFAGFEPDACLVNRYVPGAKMGLHQDRNERDYRAPVVSVSLGLPALFLLGGLSRSERPRRVPLLHGDVIVWGGIDRLRFHGVLPLEDGSHPLMGAQRINFTLRKAG